MKNPPWRYVAGAATICFLFTLLLGTYHSPPTFTTKLNTGITDDEDFGLEEGATEGATHNYTLGLLEDTLNSTLGFQKILAINLPERTDNRDALILAGALTNIDITFIDAIYGIVVADKALPPGERNGMSTGNIGSWRAHINALQTIVYHNYTSALILEDDIDWDIRLKPLLRDYARSLAALAASPLTTTRLDFSALPPLTNPPTTSPYGDDWDLLWLGHCGMMLSPSRTVIHPADPSVPEPAYLASWQNGGTPLAAFPPHTRVATAQVLEPVCSLGYAVSQRGARSLLYHLGLRAFDLPFDVSLRAWCQGRDGNDEHRCPGTLPPFFDHHRRRGSTKHDSDINDNDGWREKAETKNIRWSVMMNLERLVRGETEMEDQWPDRDGKAGTG